MTESSKVSSKVMGCPFCGGTIEFPTDKEGRHSEILHSMPPCKRYLNPDEDALGFVRACNLEVARRRGVGLS